jgi:hypothetical protein
MMEKKVERKARGREGKKEECEKGMTNKTEKVKYDGERINWEDREQNTNTVALSPQANYTD